MITPLALLLDRCGLSHREAASFCSVRVDTVKSWSSGRNPTPPGVIAELRKLYAHQLLSAQEALTMIAAAPPSAEIELGLSADDHEAQALGWPCVGAQAAMLGMVVARAGRPVRIVPRGSTPGTAAAAQAHGH